MFWLEKLPTWSELGLDSVLTSSASAAVALAAAASSAAILTASSVAASSALTFAASAAAISSATIFAAASAAAYDMANERKKGWNKEARASSIFGTIDIVGLFIFLISCGLQLQG